VHNYKVSLIILVYNAENYLRKCLDSAIAQTLRDIEIIIVNDGSTDSSISIIREYEEKEKRIKVINQQNGGIGTARNFGLNVASGDFIGFLDSDDWIDTSFLEKLYLAAIEQNADIATCNSAFVVEGSDRLPAKKRSKKFILTSAEALKKIIGESGIRSYACNKIYRRTLFTMNNISYPTNVKCYEDMATTFKLIYYSTRVVMFTETLYYYLQREGSITKKIKVSLVFDNIIALSLMREFLERKGIFKKYIWEYRFLCFKMMMYSLFSLVFLNKDKSETSRFKIIRKAMKDYRLLMSFFI